MSLASQYQPQRAVILNHVGHKETTIMLAQIKDMITWDQRKSSAETLKGPGDLCGVEY